MSDPDALSRFVREALAVGRDRADIAATLRQAGWAEEQIDTALGAYAEIDYPVPVPRPKPYLSAKEAFWYLVLFTTLYLTAFHLGSLLFEFIEMALPDPAEPDYASSYRASEIRRSVAVLVVAFPIFLYMARLVTRALRRDPAKRTSKVRRWLTYLTMFIAVCILIADLTTLIYSLLDGALTLRVFLKALVVAVIAGAILGYYLWDLRRDEDEGT